MGILGGTINTNKGILGSVGGFKNTGILGGASNIKTSTELYDLAASVGLQKQADKALSQQTGEQTKKIFSGGFISDIFDVLNAMQYGVVGLLKGKGFIQGVQERESWTDEDALGDNGLPGVIAGIALDIACDPLMYIAPWTIAKKIPGMAKGATALKELAFGKMATKTIRVGEGIKTFQQLEGGRRAGKYLANKFAFMFGVDPIYKEAHIRSIKNIAIGANNVRDMVKGISDFSAETASQLLTKDETGRFMRVGLNKLKDILDPQEFKKVEVAWNKLDDLGKQAVEVGLLNKGTFEANLGEYIKNAYTEFELKKSQAIFGFMKTGVKGIKKRVKELTPEKMAELGQIDNPGYLLFRSVIDLTKDIENAKLFNLVGKQFASDVMQEGFKQLPKTNRLGEIAGKFVPSQMFDYIQEMSEPANYTFGKKIIANFKFMKVILNPATHARNIMSNQILNWWKLGMNPLDPRTINAQLTAISEIARGGGKFMDEAKTIGYGLNTFASNELTNLLDNPAAISGVNKTIQGIKSKLANLYQGEENMAKLSAFIFNRNKGIGLEEAWKMAENATFNYAQVTPFVRQLRTALFGFPFITFTIKAAPIAAETMLKAPHRISVFGKIKRGIENMADIKETERERASEPPWIRDGFYIKLPIKDKNGNSAYFDLTYIIPFGDLVSGQFFGRQIKRETGLPESIPEALMGNAPTLNFLKEISRNQDFFGDKIWNTSDSTDKQLGDLFRHLTKTYLPPMVADEIPGGYMPSGKRRQKGIIGALRPQEKEAQQRTLMEEMLRNVGAKIQPINADIQETYSEWNRKKALETLLIERGIMKRFQATYIPK